MNRYKRQGFGWIECAVVLAVLLIFAAVLFPIIARTPTQGRRASCQSNLKQIGLGFLQYSQNYKETFPRVALSDSPVSYTLVSSQNTPYGWADAIYPYVKSRQLFQCSSETNAGQDNAAQPNYTDYWMNGNLSALPINKVNSTATTILGGDGNDGHDATTARYTLYGLSTLWKYDLNSPAYRHLGTINLLFADGHVKAIKPHVIVPSPSRGPSFFTR